MTDTSLSYLQLGCADLWHGMPIPRICNEQKEQLTDLSVASVAVHGNRTPRLLDVNDTDGFDWIKLKRGHAEELFELIRESGAGAPILVVPDVRRKRHRAVYGYAQSLPTMKPYAAAWTHANVEGLSVLRDREP